MCVVVAKHFKDIGWVIAKNRDQDYVSDITFVDKNPRSSKELFLLYDHNTGYKEGMKFNGLAIITASLEPNIEDKTDRSDGIKIEDALKLSDPEEAAKYLIGKKLTGYIFIANKNKLVLIEAAKDNHGEGQYHSKVRIIPHTEIIARTNHGIDLPWAGFQYGFNDKEDVWRKSSEIRQKLAEKITKLANTPVQMLDNLAQKHNSDLQMNTFRVESKPKQMRTIFQWALVPSHNTIYVRPIQCRMKLKVTKEFVKMVLVDNKPLQKIYNGRIKHFTKVKETDKGEYLDFTSESTLSYGQFINNIME